MANEKRLIDVNEVIKETESILNFRRQHNMPTVEYEALLGYLKNRPTVEAEPVVHGRWVLTAHEEYANYRWNVTAECSECHHDKGEVYASFITGFPTDIARDIVLEHAESVKLDNYCPNCGAKMDGDGNV